MPPPSVSMLPRSPREVLVQALEAHRLLERTLPEASAFELHRTRRHEINNLMQSLLLNINELRGVSTSNGLWGECLEDARYATRALQ